MDQSTVIDDLQISSDETVPISEPKDPEEEMLLLKTELGVLSASEVIYLVQGLKAQIKVLIVSAAGKRAPQAADSRDPYAAMNKIRDFANKVSALNGTIASMEHQLMSLYGDRERLEQEIGAGEVEDVIAAFRAQQATISSMETQLSTLYADRQVLDGQLGRSEPQEIVSMFHSVTKLVQDAQRELEPAAA
jgi:hypothetical protein